MKNHLTERFKVCLAYLKSEKLVASSRQFCKTIEVHPQCISDIMTGKREVNLDILSKAIMTYKLNTTFLFTGEGPIIKEHEECTPPKVVSRMEAPVAVVTDDLGKERIVHVPHAAHAGYLDQQNDPSFLQQLPTFSLPDPRFQYATHRCFDVAGDSMEPCLFNGDKIVCQLIDPDNWPYLKDNHVYMIATENSLVVKRVKNRIAADGKIYLNSDNTFYNTIELDIREVKEIWQVTYTISPFLSSPNNLRSSLHTEMDNFRTTISEQSKIITSLNSTIEKLLKQSRREQYTFKN